MIVSLVVIILGVIMFTDFDGRVNSIITMGFLAFFFIYLLRLLNVISTPFKVGRERTEDDVSMFLLTEFIVHAASEDGVAAEDVEAQAEHVEAALTEIEADDADPDATEALKAVEEAAEVVDSDSPNR